LCRDDIKPTHYKDSENFKNTQTILLSHFVLPTQQEEMRSHTYRLSGVFEEAKQKDGVSSWLVLSLHQLTKLT